MNTRRLLKFVHTLGSFGVAGGIAALMLILGTGPDPAATPEYQVIRESVYAISRNLVLPSMVLVFVSGGLAMAFHFPFQNALWVWLKFGTGLLILEAVLASIDSPARRAVNLVHSAMRGEIAETELLAAIDNAWAAWWAILLLAGLNVLLAIWRPRFKRKKKD